MLKNEIKKLFGEVLSDLKISVDAISVDYPADQRFGDYSTNVALIAAKKAGKNPMELAEKIVEELGKKNQKSTMFNQIEVAKPGFINFWVSEEEFLKEVSANKIPQMGKGKKVIVEYSSPNIAKPFTIGHLRSTIIGDAVANLLEAVGYEVSRDNHIGDWGTQFGKQIAAIKELPITGFKEGADIGEENEKIINNDPRPIIVLVELYVRFHEKAEKEPSMEDKAREWFKKLEDGDPEARRLWRKCIDWSWKEFDFIYSRLGVSFTENGGRGYGESFFEDRMADILEELKEKHLLKEGKEGAKIVEFSKDTKLPPLMIIKKDGATLYSTRDLATDRFRLFEHKEYGRDVLIINEVGIEQTLYFQQLYKLEEMLGWVKQGQRVHIKHGHYRFKEGKMSTRRGNVIWLENVLAQAIMKAQDLSKDRNVDLAEKVGIGALKWNDLKRDSKQDIEFDWDEILNMQGNSGPYLQYTYARTQSVLAKDPRSKIQDPRSKKEFNLIAEEREVLRLLARFPEIVEEAATRYAPNILCTYLFELAQAFNFFYQKQPILKAEGGTRNFRLQLTQKTGGVLKNGLGLLGIASPERM